MELKIGYVPSPRTLLRAYRDSHPVQFWLRRIVQVGAVLACSAVVVLSLLRPQNTNPGLLLVAMAVAVAWFAEFAVHNWRIRRLVRSHGQGQRPVMVTMGDDEIRFAMADRTCATSWTAFTHVYRRRDSWVLRLTPKAAVTVPTWALDAAQTSAFIELARSKGLWRE